MSNNNDRKKVGGTTAYSYKKMPSNNKGRSSTIQENSWVNSDWSDYEHQKHLNKLANEKIDNLYYEVMGKINNTQAEIVDKIIKMHKESKSQSVFDDYLEEDK